MKKTEPQQLDLMGMDTDTQWHRALADLETGIAHIRQSPAVQGIVELIVCRPRTGERKVLPEGWLDVETGLRGDNWKQRGFARNADGLAHPDMQLNLMNARAIALIAGTSSRWALAGDQFYVDLDLSAANLPPGTRLQLGDAIIQVTAEPHLGCKKFQQRFGKDAVSFVNSPVGRELNLRGINARVVQGGKVPTGATITRLNAN